MTITVPRVERSTLEPTMFLRTIDSSDRRAFEQVLPWSTPLLVYAANGQDWVRWSIPTEKAQLFGLAGRCPCCGEPGVTDEYGYQFDTALRECDWWLETHDYVITPLITTPTTGEQS